MFLEFSECRGGLDLSRKKAEQTVIQREDDLEVLSSGFDKEEFLKDLRRFISQSYVIRLGPLKLEQKSGQVGVPDDKKQWWVHVSHARPYLTVYNKFFVVVNMSLLRMMKNDPIMSKYMKFNGVTGAR